MKMYENDVQNMTNEKKRSYQALPSSNFSTTFAEKSAHQRRLRRSTVVSGAGPNLDKPPTEKQ
jgi:hypothetical protein